MHEIDFSYQVTTMEHDETTAAPRYLTTEYLVALWTARTQHAVAYERANPNDPRGAEHLRERALGVLCALRLLSTLEQQVGLKLALPVLGPLDPPTSRVS